MDIYILLAAALGLLLSLWGALLDVKVQANPDFKAACDFSEKSSCTKTLKSRYSRLLFGISNTYFGIAFFAVMLVLAYLGGYQHVIFYSSAVGTLISGWLFAIIYLKQKNYCSLCFLLFASCAALTWLTYPF